MKHVIVVAILLFIPIVAVAETIYVPDDYGTIQAAIDASVDGDTIIVLPGTYVENISFNGKAITLQSEQGADVTTIDGNQTGRVVMFQDGEGLDSVIDGFTIKNGSSVALGGGILCKANSSPLISNNVIAGNSASYGGGICCNSGCSPMITTNTIIDNSADYGGGIYCNFDSSPIISNNSIIKNTASGSGGGAYCVAGSSPQITNNTITVNMADFGGGILSASDASSSISNNNITNNFASYGGGIYCYVTISLLVSDNTITGNSAEYGGGICCNAGSSPLITNNTITVNMAENGGGIYFWDSSPIISDNSITNNTATWNGGGIRSYNATPVILNNLFDGNSGLTGGGISIYFEETGFPPATVTGNIVLNNTAANGGGGIALSNTTTPVLNNIFTGNRALTLYGAAINVNYDSDVLIANNTITGNSADVLSGGGIAVIFEASATLENNIMWGNSSPAGKELSLVDNSTVTIGNCDVDGGQSSVDVEAGSTLNWGGGMIDEDPLFCTGPLGDYYLSQDPCQPGVDNPCVDTGNPFSPMIDGTTRTDCICDVDWVDMGYHYAIPDAPLDTVTADLGCVPDSGILPFATQLSVTLGNAVAYDRTVAGRLNLTLASGEAYLSWRAGYTNLGPNEMFVNTWMQSLPALGSLVGANVVELQVEDVTPTPYNQPPYPPSGDIDTATCTVMGEALTK